MPIFEQNSNNKNFTFLSLDADTTFIRPSLNQTAKVEVPDVHLWTSLGTWTREKGTYDAGHEAHLDNTLMYRQQWSTAHLLRGIGSTRNSVPHRRRSTYPWRSWDQAPHDPLQTNPE